MNQAEGKSAPGTEELASRDTRRIAFFGGSFDPPHLGHLAIARAARDAFHLSAVLFAPVGAQPLKPEGSAAGFEDRLAMTRLAIERRAWLCGFACRCAPNPRRSANANPNYTLETLDRLRRDFEPGTGALLPDGRGFVLRPAALASRRGDSLRGIAHRGLATRPAARWIEGGPASRPYA